MPALATDSLRPPQDLLARGRTNGVEGLRILDQAELRRVEPNIGADATGALFAPSAGVVIPFEFTIALAENAAMNGVDFKCSREVTAIDPETNEEDGDGGENGSGKYEVKASYYPSAVAQAQQRQRGAWFAKLLSLKGGAIVAVIASVGVVVWQTTASASVAIGVIVAALMFYGEMFLAESPKGKLVEGKVRGGGDNQGHFVLFSASSGQALPSGKFNREILLLKERPLYAH